MNKTNSLKRRANTEIIQEGGLNTIYLIGIKQFINLITFNITRSSRSQGWWVFTTITPLGPPLILVQKYSSFLHYIFKDNLICHQ